MTRAQANKKIQRINKLMEEARNEIEDMQDQFENDGFYDGLEETKYTIENALGEFSKATSIYEDGGLDDELEN